VNGFAATERTAIVPIAGDRSRSAVVAEVATVKTGYIKVVLLTPRSLSPDARSRGPSAVPRKEVQDPQFV